MNDIEITDEKKRMEEIGKEIIVSYSSKYNSAMMTKLMGSIDRHMPNAGREEKERRFYRTIYNYWVYGNDVDEDFYLGFDYITNEKKCGYMTLRKKLIYLSHLNNKVYSHLFDDKYETYKLLKPYYFREIIQINGREDYDLFCSFVRRHPSFVVKPCNLSFAIGVYRVDIKEPVEVEREFARILENGLKYKKEYWGKTTSVILEELIPQHDKISSLHSSSVNGIRVTTVRVHDNITIYHPWIKVGVGGDFIASASQGGLDIGIDPVTGILNTRGFNEEGESFSEHPTTGIKFIGFQIPDWTGLVDMAKKIAMDLPSSINYIGWDFALTNNGWCIVEGNYWGDFMWQMFMQKGSLQEFEELIGWKFDKKFWWQ